MRTWRGLVLASALVVLTGCGEARVTTEDDLCVQYDDLVTQVEGVQDIDPDTATADEVRTWAQDVQDQLDAFQAVADGRVDTAVTTMRADVQDLAAAAVDAGQEALDTARPLIEDTVDDLAEAWGRVQQLVDPICGEA